MASPRLVTLLSSSARTASTQSLMQDNAGWAHAIIIVDVTVGAAAETLTPQVEAYIPTSDTWEPITAFAATATGYTGEKVYIIGPGVVETAAISDQEVAGVPIPVKWRVNITHSSTGSWTYSVVVHLI